MKPTAAHRRRPRAVLRPRLLLPVAALVASVLLVSGCSSPSPTAPSTSTGGTSAPASPAASRPAAPAGDLPAALQTELQNALAQTMAEYQVPGAAVGVWIPGQGSWTFASGLADVAGGVPTTTTMEWPLRSITKSYTVTLLLQLVDQGKVSLDDTIGKYIDGVTDGDTITLRQLANMSSGNADYTSKAFEDDFTADPTTTFSLADLNSYALGQPAQFAPGAERVYTNSNTNLIGAVVEKVTGKSFSDALQQGILNPLGQSGTTYIDGNTWPLPHPNGYVVTGGAAVEQPQNPSIFGAAGAMFSTLDDTRVWADTLGSGSLLSAATQKEREVGAPLDAGPPYDSYALGIGQTNGWWGHNGEGFGFTAAAFHDPATGASIVVFMNESDLPGVHPADLTFRSFAQILATNAE